MLLSLNCPSHPRSNYNETPSDLAMKNNHKDCLALLRSCDKKENVKLHIDCPQHMLLSDQWPKKTCLGLLTSLSNRTVNLKAMLLGFLAEKSLPFTVAPDLLELVKGMSKDRKALNCITMHQNAASYKTRFGISKTVKEALLEDLQKEFFSLNLDGSTNSSNQKIVTVLVNYMTKDGNISTKHLSSYCVDNVNNGDSCHHVHNAAKQFSKPFGMHVESLCTDMQSPDMCTIFGVICCVIKVKCIMLQTFVSFRLFSIYDAAQDLLRLLGALTFFYFPFLSPMNSSQFLHIVISVYKACNVGNTARDHIRNPQKTLAMKALTQAGKKRITKKLFDQRLETQLIANLFVSVERRCETISKQHSTDSHRS
ncbi:hypothetical protein AVEN_25438-1 [Araneus ventricosus]|uniref:DUF4371 domain-containing protein n=1 Tax=Araneus ventricosus TaxID=182803 RepID=A0A4Y2NFY9_ARAVE|nr:hypothetical protein AVEN_25438-1 [Araneus ventricosus]